jgi:ketosteroid isomerase-like protein
VNANDSGFFHIFRATNLRFFNNLAVVVNTEDERIESLKSIADSVGVAMELGGQGRHSTKHY